MAKGKIISAISGFYDVMTDQGDVIRTKPRGLFRNQKKKPFVGDLVLFEPSDSGDGTITDLLPRKNELVRPPIVNVDAALLVMSAVLPVLNTFLLDRYLVYLESLDIKPIIVISKHDLLAAKQDQLATIKSLMTDYQTLGYETFFVDDPKLFHYIGGLSNQIVVIMGQSGVGKSTLVNRWLPHLKLETQPISDSLNRGKHTTRTVNLYRYGKAFIADTPGFSDFQLPDITVEELADCFVEWHTISPMCKFKPCSHSHEPKCAVKEFVKTSQFYTGRYEHYLKMKTEIENQKPSYERK